MESYIIYIIILLITGAGIGFMSGLLGVGGGFIMVPVQFWVLTSMGVDPTIAIRVSLGTSLAVILPTALSGAYGHYRKNAVLLKPAAFLAAAGIFGGIIGGTIASNIPGNILAIFFGLAALVVAIRMIIPKKEQINEEPKDGTLYYTSGGLFAGLMSGLLGVGGGFIIVPFMTIIMKYDIHKAIGTSTLVIVFIAIGGILSYVLNGIGVSELPPYSLGYINLLQLVILAITSVPMAQLGARAAHKLPAKQLNYIFVVMLVYVGLKMSGIF
ncbi:sulfite exporter TauE/SafE family protein [Methanobacterium oryzae]|uniref:sulfite exporter TauE/SafE family protein n=1 Tax=Methanobacterium oryzae TaxID=69540 RepID=UPI003D1A3301